jgi:hypothetical protein
MLGSYSKIYHLGHRATQSLKGVHVYVEEKVDGSQFSFGVCGQTGDLLFRSRGKQIYDGAVQDLFIPSVEHVKSIKDQLTPGWVYRGEAICRPKHNHLFYNRTPKGNIALFDVDKGGWDCVTPQEKAEIAEAIGVECVPLLWEGVFDSDFNLDGQLDRESFLGGAKIEGFVMKQYEAFDRDKKPIMAKYVTEAFKEIALGKDPGGDPKKKQILDEVVSTFGTRARWEKAIQHLRESGELTDSPKDIGPLLKEIQSDIEAECGDMIKDMLYNSMRKQILRGCTNGFPEWFKRGLAKGVISDT